MSINTEKPSGKAEQKRQGKVNTKKSAKIEAPKKVKEKKKEVSEEIKTETPETKSEEKPKEEKKVEEKKKEVKKPVKKIKKEEVAVNAKSLPISTKYAVSLCKFVKHKKIESAIKDLEQVLVFKKAVPMRGEIPHRKGKMMSGRFPKKATEHFIMLLKSLLGNANNHDVDEPVITEAIANLASRPYGKFGRVKRKRTHVTIKCKTKIKKPKTKK